MRPARNLTEGHRYVVTMRNLKNAAGQPHPAVGRIRGRDQPQVDERSGPRAPAGHRCARSSSDTRRAKIRTRDLYLAWDFTVGSAESIAGRMLHIRDDAYAALGAGAPTFTVTTVDENPNANILRRVRGTFDVPLYLTGTGEPGSQFVLGPDGLPVRNGTFHAEFRCLIPKSTVAADGTVNPGRSVIYGHGLLGSTNEIEGHAALINSKNMVLCATPWIGMSSADFTQRPHDPAGHLADSRRSSTGSSRASSTSSSSPAC